MDTKKKNIGSTFSGYPGTLKHFPFLYKQVPNFKLLKTIKIPLPSYTSFARIFFLYFKYLFYSTHYFILLFSINKQFKKKKRYISYRIGQPLLYLNTCKQTSHFYYVTTYWLALKKLPCTYLVALK